MSLLFWRRRPRAGDTRVTSLGGKHRVLTFGERTAKTTSNVVHDDDAPQPRKACERIGFGRKDKTCATSTLRGSAVDRKGAVCCCCRWGRDGDAAHQHRQQTHTSTLLRKKSLRKQSEKESGKRGRERGERERGRERKKEEERERLMSTLT